MVGIGSNGWRGSNDLQTDKIRRTFDTKKGAFLIQWTVSPVHMRHAASQTEGKYNVPARGKGHIRCDLQSLHSP